MVFHLLTSPSFWSTLTDSTAPGKCWRELRTQMSGYSTSKYGCNCCAYALLQICNFKTTYQMPKTLWNMFNMNNMVFGYDNSLLSLSVYWLWYLWSILRELRTQMLWCAENNFCWCCCGFDNRSRVWLPHVESGCRVVVDRMVRCLLIWLWI